MSWRLRQSRVTRRRWRDGSLALVALLAFAIPVHASPPEIPTPPAAGVDTQVWTSAQVGPPGGRVAARLELPDAWSAHADPMSTLFEPDPNPLDLGALIIFASAGDLDPALAQPDGVVELLADVVTDPREVSRSPTQVQVERRDRDATRVRVAATFDDGRPATLEFVHLAYDDLVFVVVVGIRDDGLGPWQGVLDDILDSATLVDPTLP